MPVAKISFSTFAVTLLTVTAGEIKDFMELDQQKAQKLVIMIV
jgi:hypothetical protein